VTPPIFTTPANGTLGALLQQNQAVVSQAFLNTYGISLGTTLEVRSFTSSGANCAGIGGAAIGLVTALIFGLMPIVQAANIRPLQVLRELPEGRDLSSIFSNLGLLLLLSLLFCLLAIYFLKDVVLAIGAVYGTFVFLALLSGLLRLVNLAVGALPVPERFTLGHLALVAFSLALAGAMYLLQPTLGMLCFVAALLGLVLAMLTAALVAWKSVHARPLDVLRYD